MSLIDYDPVVTFLSFPERHQASFQSKYHHLQLLTPGRRWTFHLGVTKNADDDAGNNNHDDESEMHSVSQGAHCILVLMPPPWKLHLRILLSPLTEPLSLRENAHKGHCFNWTLWATFTYHHRYDKLWWPNLCHSLTTIMAGVTQDTDSDPAQIQISFL